MSFGYGVGDCIVEGRLAWKIFVDFKEAPETFHDLRTEVLALHTVLERTKHFLGTAALSPGSQSELDSIIDCCNRVLQSLDEIIIKYKRVGEKTKSLLDRIRLSNQDIVGIRQRLIASVVMLTMFIMLADPIKAFLVPLLTPITLGPSQLLSSRSNLDE